MDHLGISRSLDPPSVLPQHARRLDPDGPLRHGELGISVEYLNIDSASWHQLRTACDDDPSRIAGRIRAIVSEAGKMHNPETGSGGMLVGAVTELGPGRSEPQPGTRVATLVSLTLTPLQLDEVGPVDVTSEKVPVRGRAILFESGIYCEVPHDMDDTTALGVLDVCGAPAWVERLVRPHTRVAVIGAGGKSGMLACAQAVRSAGNAANVVGLCWPPDTVPAAEDAGVRAVAVDCTDPVAVASSVAGLFGGRLADLVVVCANVPGCEGGAILACSDEGRVLFFSMATSFTTAALTAEGLGKSCEMTIGNGYVPGHARLALELVRSAPAIMKRFAS